MTQMIIHCCWFGGPKTKLARTCRASWERFAPDWEIREWNEANVAALRDLPGWEFFQSALSAKKWAMASDWLRMAVLWKDGGVYLDYDVELVGDLDRLCASGEWVAGEWTASGDVWMNPGSGIALKKGSRVAGQMLDEYGRLAFDPQRDMMPWINARLRLKVEVEGIASLPPEVMSPIDVRGVCHRTADTVGIHHYAMSWASPKRRIAKWLSWHGGRKLVEWSLLARKFKMRNMVQYSPNEERCQNGN